MHRNLFGALLALSVAAALNAQQTVETVLPNGQRVVLTAPPGAAADEVLKSYIAGFDAGLQLAAPSSQRPAVAKTGTSRIAGRVTGSNGTPLRMATVRIMAPEAGINKVTSTEADGRYEFRDLPAGRFTVSGTKANYLTLTYGQAKPTDLPKNVELAANQTADRIDLVLPRGGVIAGRVLDEYGEPVTDATVYPMQKRFVQGRFQLMQMGRNAMTNDIGEFRIYGLSPGQYYVSSMSRPMNVPTENNDIRTGYASVYYPGTSNPSDAQPITVGLSETIGGIDLSLLSTRLSTVSGSAMDGQGAILNRGSVMATERSGSPTAAATAPIRPDGTFQLSGLAPGEYLLRATVPPPPPVAIQDKMTILTQAAQGVVSVQGSVVNGVVQPGSTVNGVVQNAPVRIVTPPEVLLATVTVNGSDVTGVLLTPLRRVSISGRVVFDPVAGRALQGNMVRFNFLPKSPEAAQGLAGPPPPNVVNDDFTFQLTAPAAEIGIRASVMSANQEWVVKSIRMNGVDITDTGIDLRGGHDVDIEVELTNRPPEVSGGVVNARGEAVKDYSLVIFPQERERWIFDSRLIAVTRSDRDGRFKIRTLPPGRYFVVALEAQTGINSQDPDFLENMRGRATPFSLSDGEMKILDVRLAVGR